MATKMTREEAIKIVQSATVWTDEERDALAMLIPELAESEDEGIRMALIKLMTVAGENYVASATGFEKEQLIAYLEKQKERGPLTKEEEYTLHRIIEYLEDETCPSEWISLLHDIYCLPYEKQKEQIPYTDFVIKPHKGDDNNPYDMRVSEAQDYAIKRGFGIPFNDGEVYVDERHMTQTIGNILRWADEHPKEQKPIEWSEEDERIRNQLIYDVEHHKKEGLISAKQNKATKALYNGIEECYDEKIAWLKSLRPQSHWKPSEEQMKAFSSYIKDFQEKAEAAVGGWNNFDTMISLYKHLKKL